MKMIGLLVSLQEITSPMKRVVHPSQKCYQWVNACPDADCSDPDDVWIYAIVWDPAGGTYNPNMEDVFLTRELADEACSERNTSKAETDEVIRRAREANLNPKRRSR